MTLGRLNIMGEFGRLHLHHFHFPAPNGGQQMENFALTLFAFASIFTRRDYLFSDEFSHVFTLGQSILDDFVFFCSFGTPN